MKTTIKSFINFLQTLPQTSEEAVEKIDQKYTDFRDFFKRSINKYHFLREVVQIDLKDADSGFPLTHPIVTIIFNTVYKNKVLKMQYIITNNRWEFGLYFNGKWKRNCQKKINIIDFYQNDSLSICLYTLVYIDQGKKIESIDFGPY